MENILIAVNVILAVILVIVILLQRSEGGALGLGVSQDSFTSARSVGSFLTKFTSIVAALFIITSIALVVISRDEIREVQSVLEKEEKQDSTNKIGFVIGFNFGEGRYLKEFLLEVLRGGFDWRDSTDKPQNNQRTIAFNTGVNEPSSSEDEEDIW